MLAATAMSHFQDEIKNAVFIALFEAFKYFQWRQLWLASYNSYHPLARAPGNKALGLVTRYAP